MGAKATIWGQKLCAQFTCPMCKITLLSTNISSPNPLEIGSIADLYRDNGIDACTCDDGVKIPYYVLLQKNNNCSDMGYRGVHSVHFADIDGMFYSFVIYHTLTTSSGDGRADYIHVNTNGVVRVDRNTGVGNSVSSWSDAGVVFTL